MYVQCFHCHLSHSKKTSIIHPIQEKAHFFCCLGCLGITQTLFENQLNDFYTFREYDSNSLKKPSFLSFQALSEDEKMSIQSYSVPEIMQTISHATKEKGIRRIELGIEGMTCSACGWLIEKSLMQLDSVVQIQVNVSLEKAILTWNVDSTLTHHLGDIFLALHRIGFKAYPYNEDARIASFKKTNQHYMQRILVSGLGMMQVMMYSLAAYMGVVQDISDEHLLLMYVLSGLVTTPIMLYSGQPFFISAWNSLKKREFGMNFPVSLAILMAYFFSFERLLMAFYKDNPIESIYFDSIVMFIFFLTIGRYLEHRARYHSIIKQTHFRSMLPLSVKRYSNNQTEIVLISHIKKDDHLIISAGGFIPVDGLLMDQKAMVNEAIMTGEFMPVTKYLNDPLISGSSNQSEAFMMRVTQPFLKSHIHSLMQLQEKSFHLKPPSVFLADKVAHFYTLGLLIILSISSFFWWFFDPTQLINTGLAILVVSCPCALSLATPAAHASAMTQLSDLGLMIQNPNTLNELASIEHIVFDKTGTLTQGTISIKKIDVFNDDKKEDLLMIAHRLETLSNHPIALAFNIKEPMKYVSIFKDQPLKEPKEIIGKGVMASINGDQYRLGSAHWIDEKKENVTHKNDYSITDDTSTIIIYLSKNKKCIASFHLKDSLNAFAKPCIQALKTISSLKSIHLLTGDHLHSAKQIGKLLHIPHITANASPEKKSDFIQKIQQNNQKAMMIGDGFNDVAAQASASVSIALANSPYFSKNKSDAVLVSNDLTVIPQTIQLAKRVKHIIRYNFIWAISYNVIAIPFAALGWISPWLAAIGMSMSSLIVVLNALRLRKSNSLNHVQKRH
jgi:Cu2+-exporting ATPase